MKRYKYAAFFDLDRTILSINSAEILVRESRRRGMMTSSNYWHAIYLSLLYKFSWRETTRIINQMLQWVKGIPSLLVEELCEEVFDQELKKLIRPGIIEEINLHRKKGGAVIMLSSAITQVCNPVARYLEMDDIICSQLESADGKLTGRSVGKLVFGKEKEQSLITYCQEHGYDPSEAYYYGDSIADLHVLNAVGYPVCIHPDKKLLKKAMKRNWKVYVWDE